MSAPPVARAFPWASLDAVRRDEIESLRAIRRWMDARLELARVPDVLSALLRTEVAVRVRHVGPVTFPAALAGGAAVLLGAVEAPQLGRGALVQAEAALVASVLRRAATRSVALAFEPPQPLTPGTTGAFAALVAAVVRRAHAGVTPRVLAAGPAESLEADLARTGEALLAATLTVLVEHDAFDARVVLPQSAAFAAPARAWSASTLAALGPTPLAVPVVACAFRASIAEVAALAKGDVVLPATWPLSRSGRTWCGPVWLAAPASAHGIRARLVEDGSLVLAGIFEPLGTADAPETTMDEGVDKAALIDAIGDVSVLVRVEVGEARMPAREWAAVGKGDVLTLGRRVGEPVVLRVGGVPVARGDLVEIDGEVGVRIVERLTGDGGTP